MPSCASIAAAAWRDPRWFELATRSVGRAVLTRAALPGGKTLEELVLGNALGQEGRGGGAVPELARRPKRESGLDAGSAPEPEGLGSAWGEEAELVAFRVGEDRPRDIAPA